MQIVGLAQKVTLYIGESDKWGRKPLYTAILELLKQEDCAGATVTRALAGFGAHSRIHTATIVDFSSDLPLIVEWVDNPARIERVMPRLRQMVAEGLITVQPVEVISYSYRELREIPLSTPVHNVMSREVHTVQPDTPLDEAASLLVERAYRTLPVVNPAGQVVGILTDGDLLARANLLPVSAQQQLTQSELAQQWQRLRQTQQTVAEVMTPNPITVTPETTLGQAVHLLAEHHFKRLPVVDATGKLVGLITRVDVLRALAQPSAAELPRLTPPPGQHRRINEIMTTNVPTVLAQAPLTEVVGRLISSAQRRVIVVDDQQQVVGLITDGDLLKQVSTAERTGLIQSLTRRLPLGQAEALSMSHRLAAEVMTQPVMTVTPDTSLQEALTLLLTHRIKRLPVVNATGQLVGLVGRGAILQALAQDVSGQNQAHAAPQTD